MISDNKLHWFSSYLKNRQQMVFIQQESSELQDVYSGVPQGSVLDPLLFFLYYYGRRYSWLQYNEFRKYGSIHTKMYRRTL